MNAGRPVMMGAYRSAILDPETRSALKTSVSMTTGPRAAPLASRLNGGEEGQAFLLSEILDHPLVVWG